MVRATIYSFNNQFCKTHCSSLSGAYIIEMDDPMTERLKVMRRDAEKIFQAGLGAVAPGVAIKIKCIRQGNILWVEDKEYDLNRFQRVVVLGAGKAGAAMALAIEDILLDRIDEGLIVVKYNHLASLKKVQIVEAGHPVPDVHGFAGAKAMYDLATSADEHTLIICLISGGGSALLPYPVEGVSLVDKQEITGLLLGCGADIHEINTIRKHLSQIKGADWHVLHFLRQWCVWFSQMLLEMI